MITLLYDVFVDNVHVGRVRVEYGVPATIRNQHVRLVLVMNLMSVEGNKKTYQVEGGNRCRHCGTNGDHYCPNDLCGPDAEEMADQDSLLAHQETFDNEDAIFEALDEKFGSLSIQKGEEKK